MQKRLFIEVYLSFDISLAAMKERKKGGRLRDNVTLVFALHNYRLILKYVNSTSRYRVWKVRETSLHNTLHTYIHTYIHARTHARTMLGSARAVEFETLFNI